MVRPIADGAGRSSHTLQYSGQVVQHGGAGFLTKRGVRLLLHRQADADAEARITDEVLVVADGLVLVHWGSPKLPTSSAQLPGLS